MTSHEPPRIEFLRGSPTPEEEEAVRAAILKLWREDRARAAREAAAPRWVLAARAEATGGDMRAIRGAGASAWRLAERVGGVGFSRRVGRGDFR